MTLLVCFCVLDWSALTPCLHGVIFCGRRSVGLSGAASLITWAWRSWAALYAINVGSLVVVGFWLLLGRSFGGPSLWMAECKSPRLPHLVCYCTGASRTKPNSPGNKTTPAKLTPTHNHTINSKWGSINKGVKRLRLLQERKSEFEMTNWKKNDFEVVEGGAIYIINLHHK